MALLSGNQASLDKYNHIAEKYNVKSPAMTREPNSSVGFIRGMRQMNIDIDTYDPHNSYLGLQNNIGGLFDTKKHFYRLISLLLTDLGLVVFHIRSPISPWQVISELRNQDIIGESDSANLKVCLSIANEIRLKTYFANGGQKESYSPLLQIPDTNEQSTDDPIFRDFDEDTLVRLLSQSVDLHQRCSKFCFKYIQQGKVDASILRNLFFPSKALVMSSLYSRLQNFPKSLECIKSISKDSPEYAECANVRGKHHALNGEWKKAIECFETALEYSHNPFSNLSYHRNLVRVLTESFQYKKARNKLEEAMKLHDLIYCEGSETRILSRLMVDLGALFYRLDDIPSAIKTLQRAEEMQKRIMGCNDVDVVNLNITMALSYSSLGQNDKSLYYLERALCLSHKIYGEHNISFDLGKIYTQAAFVYRNCGQNDEAFSWLERCLKLMETLHGDTVHPGKTVY